MPLQQPLIDAEFVSFIFYIFAALLIYFSLRSFLGGINYLNYFNSELAKPNSEFTPFATVIAPCKGIDEGMKANLNALLEQDYPDYEIIFVVDDENDPAVNVISEMIPVQIVIAPKSTNSSQKVENLREAVLHAGPRSEVFAFVDSDARPSPNWLRSLVAPLENEGIGAATGYRWFIPEKPTLASEIRSAWNASIASALGPNTKSNFCWGGSTAIRRDTFERLNMRHRWAGTLSDDFTVTRVMKEAGLAIQFVPPALTPSHESCTFAELLEFTTRQMKITRVYATPLWLMSFFGSGLFTFVLIGALLTTIFSKTNTILVWSAIATLSLVTAFSVGKSWLRLKAVRMVIPQARTQVLPQLTLWLLAPPLFLLNCFAALLSRRLTWRGVRYKLVSHDRTVRRDSTEN